jgi:hypothetical protein
VSVVLTQRLGASRTAHRKAGEAIYDANVKLLRGVRYGGSVNIASLQGSNRRYVLYIR